MRITSLHRQLLISAALAGLTACGSKSSGPVDPVDVASTDPAVDVSPPHLVIVVQGTYAWMGNDTYAKGGEEDQVVVGGYSGLVAALDTVATFKPDNTVALLVATGDEPRGRQLYGGAITGLTGAAVGPQKAYANDIATGLETALHAIEAKLSTEDGRKVIIVIGDGSDVMEAFDAPAAGERLKQAKFEVYSIYYSPSPENPGSAESAKALGFSGHRAATSRDEIAAHLAALYHDAFGG